jgi:plastocyanin
MNVRSKAIWDFAALAGIVLVAACGSEPNPGGPSGGGGGGGGNPPVATTTITITSSGVNPKNITVTRGTQVTFINNDSRAHDMASNPHPTHGSCVEIENGVGFIQVGQTKMTGNLNNAGTCGYHDHNRDADTSLQGTITIQ